jgi:hypothetical protein
LKFSSHYIFETSGTGGYWKFPTHFQFDERFEKMVSLKSVKGRAHPSTRTNVGEQAPTPATVAGLSPGNPQAGLRNLISRGGPAH